MFKAWLYTPQNKQYYGIKYLLGFSDIIIILVYDNICIIEIGIKKIYISSPMANVKFMAGKKSIC